MNDNTTIMLCGRTGSGKTPQVGLLAKRVFKATGKRTRLYCGDPGGIRTVRPLINLGIIKPVYMGTTKPWIFWDRAVRGFVRNAPGKKPIWIQDHDPDIGCYAFEGGSSMGEALKGDLALEAGLGNNIGGEKLITFKREDEGVTVSVGGNNRSHYGIIQQHVQTEMLESFKLPGEYVVWTTRLSKQQEEGNVEATISGPEILGKAKTGDVPAWFNLTLRIDVVPADDRKSTAERHVMYLTQHRDNHTVGRPLALGNARVPLGAKLAKTVIEPADINEALDLLEGAEKQVEDDLRKELGL